MDIGLNKSQIHIRNYDNKRWSLLKGYLEGAIGKDLKICKTIKKGNSYSMGLEFKNTSLACIWLDKLLQNKQIKDFRIPGAEKGQKAKMKFHLVVQ